MSLLAYANQSDHRAITTGTHEYDFDLGNGLVGASQRVKCLRSAIDIFQLKIHPAEVQSCFVRASYFYYATQIILLLSIRLRLCINLSLGLL